MVHTSERFRVELPGPLDPVASLRPLERWGDDLIDRWDGALLRRSIRAADTVIPYAARPGGTLDEPVFDVEVADVAHAEAVRATVERMFVSDAGPFRQLAARDPALAELDAAFPGVRPVLQPDPFTALVRAISAQQVNLRWATEIRRRLVTAYGTEHEIAGSVVRALDPVPIASATVAELRDLQLTNHKAASVIACARAVLDGTLTVGELERLDDDEVIARLVRLPGIGRWSAEWFLARTLGRPRVVAGDLGVRKAVGAAYYDGRLPSEAEVRAATAHWGQAAGVAQQLVLHALAEGALPVAR